MIGSLYLVTECEAPPNGNNAVVVSNDLITSVGETYTYKCLCGYNTTDELVTTCTSDGSWSEPPPECNCKNFNLYYDTNIISNAKL